MGESENLKREDHSEDLGVDGRKSRRNLLRHGVTWNEFIRLRVGTSGGLL
jgi:hypothetical protein